MGRSKEFKGPCRSGVLLARRLHRICPNFVCKDHPLSPKNVPVEVKESGSHPDLRDDFTFSDEHVVPIHIPGSRNPSLTAAA